jgi:hypothetical protein
MAPPRSPLAGLAVLAVVAAVFATPSSAGAAVTLGPPDLSTPGSFGYGCQQNQTCSFVHLPGPNFTAAAPSNGVITRWRFRISCCLTPQTVDPTATLKVFQQTFTYAQFGYSSARAVRTGPSFVVPPGGVVTADNVVDVPVRLRIDAGEVVGVNAEDPIGFNGFGGAQMIYWQPALADAAEGYNNLNGALSMNVDVEPDGDGDGYGDETQDCQPGDPAQHQACSPPPTTPISPPPVKVEGPCVGVCGGGGAVFSGVPKPAPPSRPFAVFISVECPTGHSGFCGGFLVAALQDASTANASRRVVLGRAKFSVAPGAEKNVSIKFNRKARKLFKRKRTRRVVITIDPDDGDPVSITRKITFRKRR